MALPLTPSNDDNGPEKLYVVKKWSNIDLPSRTTTAVVEVETAVAVATSPTENQAAGAVSSIQLSDTNSESANSPS